MDAKERLLSLSKEEFNSLLDSLKILMNECDAEYLELTDQLRRNQRLIFNLTEQNKKMDDRMRKVFGRKNNKLIKETQEKNKWIRQKIALSNPLTKFNNKCSANGICSYKLREIFSEERGWSIVE